MRSGRHREWWDWLGRLPRREATPSFRRHLEGCEECRRLHRQIDPVAAALNAVRTPSDISHAKLVRMAHEARRAAESRGSRLLILKLSLVGLGGLPLMVGINWLAATAGYDLLSNVSSGLARFFLVSFAFTAIVLNGLALAAIPLLIGWVRGREAREAAP